MKKLTKANIDDLQKQMPLLDEQMQRFVLGGGTEGTPRTNCFFYVWIICGRLLVVKE